MWLRFTVPGPVRPKARPRLGMHGNVYTPKETSGYEFTVRTHAQAAMARMSWTRTSAPVAVTARVFWPDAKRRDLDNAIKVCCDALNGAAWDDDSQVVELHAYSEVDARAPRLEVEVMKKRENAE